MKPQLTVARLVVTAGLLAGLSVPARAVGVRFGAEVGFGYTLFKYANELDAWTPDGRFAPNGGGYVDLIFKDEMFRVTPGVRGFRVHNYVDVNTGPDPLFQEIGEFEVTLDYLAFPVLFKFKPAHNAGLYLFAGPEFGVLVSTRYRSVIRQIENQSDITIVEDVDEDIKDRMKSYNFSGVVGLGQQRAVRGHVASARLQYNYGFVDVAKQGAWYSNWRTRAFEFVLGFGW